MKKFLILIFFILPLFVCSQDSLVLGEFIISKIIDGDTFRFEGIDKSTRLVGVDTEETYMGADAEQKASDITPHWTEYYSHKKDSSGKPAKIPSPFGFETWQWTKEMFKDVVKARLEYDGLSRTKDMYGRHLLYVIAIREDGTEFNYNVECVKQGYSPYFSKYGYVERFHEEFLEAQQYAMNNKLGIWNGLELCYPDYDERLLWWNQRALQIVRFENEGRDKQGYFSMLDDGDFEQLKFHVGDTVVLFGSIIPVPPDKYYDHLSFVINEKGSVELVFYGNYDIINKLDLNNPKDYYIYVKGVLKHARAGYDIVIDNINQIWSE